MTRTRQVLLLCEEECWVWCCSSVAVYQATMHTVSVQFLSQAMQLVTLGICKTFDLKSFRPENSPHQSSPAQPRPSTHHYVLCDVMIKKSMGKKLCAIDAWIAVFLSLAHTKRFEHNVIILL